MSRDRGRSSGSPETPYELVFKIANASLALNAQLLKQSRAKAALPQVVKPNEIDGTAALVAAQSTPMSKRKGERDTEFVKRIVSAYFNAVGALGVNAIQTK